MTKNILLLILFFSKTTFAKEIKYSEKIEPKVVRIIEFFGLRTGIEERTIYWKTNEEKDFDYYQIERSIDAKTFEIAGTVKSTGNNKSGDNYYEFADAKSKEYNLYRIKAVDLDGKWSYSKIIKVDNTIIINLNTTEAIIGNLYPNPTMSSVTIEMFLIKEEEWNISTYDISGNLTMMQKNVLPVGLIRYTIGDSALKQGLNIVIMESKSTTIKKCIVKN